MSSSESPPSAEDQMQHLSQRLNSQQANQEQIMLFLQDLTTRLDRLQAAVTSTPSLPASVSSAPALPATPGNPCLRLPPPPCFSGDPKACRGFLNQCSIHFELSSHHFPTDRTKVAYIISLLSGDALAWASPLWERQDPSTSNLQTFLDAFRKTFDEPGKASSAAGSLLRLRQQGMSVGQYAVLFRTLAAELTWNNEALTATFWQGLSKRIKDELAGRTIPSTLDDLIALSIQIDIRFQERALERSGSSPSPSGRPAQAFQKPTWPSQILEEPMQLGRTRLTPEERTRRLNLGLCLYCGGKGHLLNSCPVRPGNSKGLGHFEGSDLDRASNPVGVPRFTLPVSILWAQNAYQLSAYVDSGAAGDFIEQSLAAELGIPFVTLSTPLSVTAVDGSGLPMGPIRFKTPPIDLHVGALHEEKMSFLILPKSSSPIILGLPWLRKHSPQLDWNSGRVLAWGPQCHEQCISKGRQPLSIPLAVTSTAPILPSQHQSFRDVFCKKPADQLPPHRDYDCSIEPLPITSLSRKGAKNVRVDALSRSFDVNDSENHLDPEPIIPAHCILATTRPLPTRPPPGKTFVVPTLLPISPLVPAAAEVQKTLHPIWEEVSKNLQLAASRHKVAADRHRCPAPKFKPGDKVWLSTKHIRLRIPSMKFAPRFIGPFPILRQVNPVAFKLRLPPHLKIPNTFHVSLLRPLILNRFSRPSSCPAPVAETSDQYEIKEILDSKHSRGRLLYLVDWKGYGPEERSWVPAVDVLAPRLVTYFHRKFPSKPAPRHVGGPRKRGGTVTDRLR